MRIIDLYRTGKPVVSFEIFPPKPALPIETVYDTLDGLKGLRPAFISVTYGAGGSNAGRAIEIADKVKNGHGIEAMAHLTCVGHTRERIAETLDALAGHGIENILALRGDPPRGESAFKPVAGGYGHAKDLVEHIRRRGGFCIAVAAYPEGHPEAPSLEQDVIHLKMKADAGADFMMTQLFFDNSALYAFRDRLAAAGIGIPMSIGIMPVLNAAQIERMTAMCGASVPAKLRALLDKYGNSPDEMERAGIDYASEQIRDLLAHGVDGIHLYTMNKAPQIKTIVQQSGLAELL